MKRQAHTTILLSAVKCQELHLCIMSHISWWHTTAHITLQEREFILVNPECEHICSRNLKIFEDIIYAPYKSSIHNTNVTYDPHI
jgi:hypothetical protein